jgi:hypothetical protein
MAEACSYFFSCAALADIPPVQRQYLGSVQSRKLFQERVFDQVSLKTTHI